VRHRLHHVGPGDEHVAGLPGHDDEVGQGGAVHRPAGAGAHDGRDLRDDARRHGVAQEDVGVGAEAHHALLDAGAARVVEADEGEPVLHGQIHDLADLLGVRLPQAAAEDGEILREDVDGAAVDGALAGHDAVGQDPLLAHPELVGAVGDEHVELDEGPLVQQGVDALARGHLALGVLGVDPVAAAALPGGLPHGAQALDFFRRTHGASSGAAGRRAAPGRHPPSERAESGAHPSCGCLALGPLKGKKEPHPLQWDPIGAGSGATIPNSAEKSSAKSGD